MADAVRVLIADDDRLVRTGIGLVLAPQADIDVVAEASSGREAVDLTALHRPDVAVLDIRMPGLDGIGALQEIRRRCPATAVVMLTTFGEAQYVAQALAHGATGFVLKDGAVEDLPRAIRAVSAGEAFLSPAVTRHVLDRLPTAPAPSVATEKLTALSDRERDVVTLLAEGLSNAEIGGRLWVTEATVKTHVSRILTKLGCDNRVQVALMAHQAGLIDQP